MACGPAPEVEEVGTLGSALVTSRLASVESSGSPFDFDQISTSSAAETAVRSSTRAYAGTWSMHSTTSGSGALYARGVFNNNGEGFKAGDDFWIGAAFFFEPGFWSTHSGYLDLIRLDSYVNDDGTQRSNRQHLAFLSESNDNIYVRMETPGGAAPKSLIGPLSPSVLPEGQWNWVELHVVVNSKDGSAFTELKINGVSKGTSTLANIDATLPNWNRARFGVVATGGGVQDLWFDRASIRSSELGPLGAVPPVDAGSGGSGGGGGSTPGLDAGGSGGGGTTPKPDAGGSGGGGTIPKPDAGGSGGGGGSPAPDAGGSGDGGTTPKPDAGGSGGGGTTPKPDAGGSGGGGTAPGPDAGGAGGGGTTPKPDAGGSGGGGTAPGPDAGGAGGGGTTPKPDAGGSGGGSGASSVFDAGQAAPGSGSPGGGPADAGGPMSTTGSGGGGLDPHATDAPAGCAAVGASPSLLAALALLARRRRARRQ